jgi:hypothetical protein
MGLVAALAASCVAIVGADKEPLSVVKKLCECDELSTLLGYEGCISVVTTRLNEAQDEERADWMLAAEAKGCFTSCDNILACYRTAPACSPDICHTGEDNECCKGQLCKLTEYGTMECQP